MFVDISTSNVWYIIEFPDISHCIGIIIVLSIHLDEHLKYYINGFNPADSKKVRKNITI